MTRAVAADRQAHALGVALVGLEQGPLAVVLSDLDQGADFVVKVVVAEAEHKWRGTHTRQRLDDYSA